MSPGAPAESAEWAVERFYRYLTPQPAMAYSALSETLRQGMSFPEFAGGYARTRDVRIVDGPHVLASDGDLVLVGVRVSARDLTLEGGSGAELRRHLWVRQEGGICALERANIRRTDSP